MLHGIVTYWAGISEILKIPDIRWISGGYPAGGFLIFRPWKVLLEERSPLQAVDTIRGLCRARGNGKVAVPRPPPPPPRGLTEKQKDHFRTIFGGGRIIKKKMISDWLSSGNSDDVVWMEVLAIYKTDRSAKDAIRGFLNHEFSKA